MTTQTIERSTQATCTTCAYFQNFGESNGRGWCHRFDHTARQQHKQTGDCEQEIEAVESAPQEPMIGRKTQTAEAGLAGDSVSCQLRSPIGSEATRSAKAAPQQPALEPEPILKAETEFQQGHIHGQNDAKSGWHPIYKDPTAEYAIGYLSGYNTVLNPTFQQAEAINPTEWSVCLDPRWGLYQAWVGDRCIGHGATYEEAERLAQRYIAGDEMIRRQNAEMMAAHAAGI